MCSVPYAPFQLTLRVLAGGKPDGSSNFGRARRGSHTWPAIAIYQSRHLTEVMVPSFPAPGSPTSDLPAGSSGITGTSSDRRLKEKPRWKQRGHEVRREPWETMSGRTVPGTTAITKNSYQPIRERSPSYQSDRELGLTRRTGGMALNFPSRRSSVQPSSWTIR